MEGEAKLQSGASFLRAMLELEAVKAFDKCAAGLLPTCQALLTAKGCGQPASVSQEFRRPGDLLHQRDSAQNLFLLLAARGLCTKLFVEQTPDWIELHRALDGLRGDIEARIDFLEPRPARASSENLLHDLGLFHGRFILAWHPATENRRACFTRCGDYNTQCLTRALYSWGMWRGSWRTAT